MIKFKFACLGRETNLWDLESLTVLLVEKFLMRKSCLLQGREECMCVCTYV